MPLFVLVTVGGRDYTVVPVDGDQWRVSSASHPGQWHTVRRWGHLMDHYACSCRDRYGGGRPPRNRVTPCVHCRAVVAARRQEAA